MCVLGSYETYIHRCNIPYYLKSLEKKFYVFCNFIIILQKFVFYGMLPRACHRLHVMSSVSRIVKFFSVEAFHALVTCSNTYVYSTHACAKGGPGSEVLRSLCQKSGIKVHLYILAILVIF